METRLTRRDRYFILVCILITGVSLAVGTHFFYRAFPEATIDFAITRDQARDQAQAFLQARGFATDTYRHSALFQYSTQAKTFLERELGLAGATARIDNPVRLWRWHNRWVREQQKEEFRVEITTSGTLVGFTHLLEEDRPGAHLDQDQARRLATDFLTTTLGHALDRLDFIEAETTQRPHRTDHSFTWKRKDFELSGATYRYYITLHGDQIGGFGEQLNVPEAWSRQYQELRARNELTGLIAAVFLFLTWLALLVVFIGRIRHRDVRWKTAGIYAGVAYTLTFLAGLNTLPVSMFNYDTTDTFTSFLFQNLLLTLLGSLAAGAAIGLLIAGAEPVYRSGFGNQVSVTQLFTATGIRTKRFLKGVILGLSLTAAFFAYQTLFYIIAQRFGAWSPADIPYSEMVNTYFPWITVLLIGFMPAVSEEFTSRAFSIPFLGKYLKSRWAAVLVAAVIWGFAHSNYPQQPFFIRGIEVSIGGIVIGLVVLRWGLLPALVWHYTIDALYTGLILLRSSNPYFTVSALVSIGLVLIPMVIALFLYIKHRRFADPTPLLNRTEPAPAPLPPRPQPGSAPRAGAVPITPLRHRRLVVAYVLAGAAAVLCFLLPAEKPLAFVDYQLSRSEAMERARHFLRAQDIDLAPYKSALTQRHQTGSTAVKYILEHQGYDGLDRFFQQGVAPSLWWARFYIPGEKEEYQVAIRPEDGTVYTFSHLLDADGPGADLDADQAQTLAVKHMQTFGLDPTAMLLKESSSTKNLSGRRDHRFVWEAPADDPRHIGEARYRIQVAIQGDAPASLRRYLKLPEAWERARAEDTAWRTALKFVPIIAFIAAFIHLLWHFIRSIRQLEIPWRLSLLCGACGSAVFLLGFFNTLPGLDSAYNTAMPYGIWRTTQAIMGLMGSIAVALLITVSLALCTSLFPDGPARLQPLHLAGGYAQALWLVPLLVLVGQVQEHLALWLKQRYAASVLDAGIQLPDGLDTLVPFWNALQNSLATALMAPVLLAVGIYFLCRVFPRPVYALALALAVLVAGAAAPAFTLGEFSLSLGLAAIKLGILLALVATLVRDNLAACILWGFTETLLAGANSLLHQSAPLYQWQGWALLFFGVSCIIGIGLWLKRVERTASKWSANNVR